MRAFAQKPNQSQGSVSSGPARPNMATCEQVHREHPILHSQRASGNQAMRQSVQTDAGESGLSGTVSPRSGHDLSRILIYPPTTGAIQTNLAINEPGDEYEQEADRVAEQVMRMPEPQLQRFPAHQSRFSEPPPIVHEVLTSPGQPLDSATSTFMESRFGHGFSQVRVHTDSRAAQLAQSLNAQAFAVGRDVVFGAGQYAPQTFEGKRLIAHELTHVLQQRNGKSVICRKAKFDSPNYIRVNPIGRILSGQPVGLTTPTVNSNPLPDSFTQAGELIFKALQPAESKFDLSTKECTFTDFAVNVSANVIIPTEPEGKKWTMNLRGSDIKGIAACHKKENVPVVMTGKPSSEAAGKWIEKNEQEHVDDLQKLYAKHIQPHFNRLLALKGKGDDSKTCQESLMSALGDKDALVVRDFLNDWGESIRKRDEGGKHTLRNEIREKNNCSRVEIESSTR